MRIEIPYSYSPTLAHAASVLVPNGKIELPGKAYIDVPDVGVDDAPVRARVNGPGGKKSEWRAYGSRWLVPLSFHGVDFHGPASVAMDMDSLARIAAAGFTPAIARETGLCSLVQGVAAQASMTGQAMLQMLERQNPRNPSTGQNRNIIDSGNWKSAESAAIASWRKAGLVSVGGAAWQTVAAPVFLLAANSQARVLPGDAAAATRQGTRTFALDDWAAAAEWAERQWGRKLECPVELFEQSAAPRM